MEKPEYFKWNPVFAHYKDNMPDNIPLSLQDEPYMDIFTYEIRWRKILAPSKIYLNNQHNIDYTSIDNWPNLFKK